MASSSKQRKQHVEHAAPQLAKPQPARELVDDFLVDPDLWESHAVKSLLSAARTTRAFAYSESFSAFVLLCVGPVPVHVCLAGGPRAPSLGGCARSLASFFCMSGCVMTS